MRPDEKWETVLKLVGGDITTNDMENISSYRFNDGQTPPTEEEVEAEFKAQEYARARQPLYPDIGDQLDDLYHKGAFSAEMTATLKKVKDDNPK